MLEKSASETYRIKINVQNINTDNIDTVCTICRFSSVPLLLLLLLLLPLTFAIGYTARRLRRHVHGYVIRLGGRPRGRMERTDCCCL